MNTLTTVKAMRTPSTMERAKTRDIEAILGRGTDNQDIFSKTGFQPEPIEPIPLQPSEVIADIGVTIALFCFTSAAFMLTAITAFGL